MSNNITFNLSDAQLAAMTLLGLEDQAAMIHSAVQAKLIAALNYNKAKIEKDAQADYNALKGYLTANKIAMPESFGQYKARVMNEVQNALNELGYTPNKKKDGETAE